VVSATGEVFGESSGAAGRVEGVAVGDGVDDLMHDGFVGVEQAVTWFIVVAGGPASVSGERVAAVDHDPVVVGEGRGGEQTAYLGQSSVYKVLVEIACPGAQQRDALQPQDVGQGMLVDHAATVAGI
jgi:hypothetical protein